MKDNRRYLLQIARGEQPKQSFIRIYTVINGEKKLQSENEIEFDEDINIEVVRGCKLNCVIFIFDSTVGDRPSAKGVHQHSRRA